MNYDYTIIKMPIDTVSLNEIKACITNKHYNKLGKYNLYDIMCAIMDIIRKNDNVPSGVFKFIASNHDKLKNNKKSSNINAVITALSTSDMEFKNKYYL